MWVKVLTTTYTISRYMGNLKFARRSGILRGMLTGASGGMFWALIFFSYALAFWYGIKVIMDDREYCFEHPDDCHIRYDPGSLIVVRTRWAPKFRICNQAIDDSIIVIF